MVWGKVMFIFVMVFLILDIGTMAIVGLESTSEVPCVDGHNRVNLEGIMCEKLSFTYFGFGFGEYFLLTMFPFAIILSFLFWLHAREMEKDSG